MISFQEAYTSVLGTAHDFGDIVVPLSKADGRVLAETITADRDFPPFDRATKDGIAIQLGDDKVLESYKIEGIAAAGSPQLQLSSKTNCIEIMTGAMLPKNADTVVMYEHLEINKGVVKIDKPLKKGQNIHTKGSDEVKGTKVLGKGTTITAAEIGVLASVGKTEVLVKRNPRITLFSTGDELVDVGEKPEPHQIRQSNAHTLRAALLDHGMASEIIHVKDEKKEIEKALKTALQNNDVLLLSGGVSKGKYDFLPEILEEIGVQQHFHGVQQRPGKPFWFGDNSELRTTIFGFPGNPTSTFANFHVYFIPWLNKCLGKTNVKIEVFLEEPFENKTDLTRFVRAKMEIKQGKLCATLIHGNGSGDLTSLTKANGFIQVPPSKKMAVGDKTPFIPTRRIV